MILAALRQAVGQLGDPRFQRVALLGLGLTLALLFGAYALFLAMAPDPDNLPVIGKVAALGDFFTARSLILLLAASIFLMMPVAAVFAALFLPDVAAAVEARNYRLVPPAPTPHPPGMIIATANLLGLMLALNLSALLFLLPLMGSAFVMVYWALNGALLGRACFLFTARRHLPLDQALAMRRRNLGTIWGMGALMAALTSLPLVNLLAPLLGVAAFAHLYHRLAAAGR